MLRIAACLLTTALGASAPVKTIDIQWDAPSGCPSGDDVARRVQSQASTTTHTVTAHGVVTELDALFVLELSVRGAGGEQRRRIESESCGALADAAGLLIAVAADPSLAEPDESEPESEPEPATQREGLVTEVTAPSTTTDSDPSEESSRHPARADAPVASPTPRLRRALGGLVRAEVTGQLLRVLPRPAGIGLGGAAGLAIHRARVEVRGHYFLAQPREYTTRPDVGMDVDLWALGAAGCFVPGRERWQFPLCGGFEAGGMTARSRGVTLPGQARAAFAAATGDAAATFAPLPRLAFRAAAGLAISLLRPGFHVRGLPELFRAGSAGLRLSLGIEVRFGSR